jgi:hypothetical protein
MYGDAFNGVTGLSADSYHVVSRIHDPFWLGRIVFFLTLRSVIWYAVSSVVIQWHCQSLQHQSEELEAT